MIEVCRICRSEEATLSYEHVPPREAFNLEPTTVYGLDDWLNRNEDGAMEGGRIESTGTLQVGTLGMGLVQRRRRDFDVHLSHHEKRELMELAARRSMSAAQVVRHCVGREIKEERKRDELRLTMYPQTATSPNR